jgi:L-ascorbate metabolism protein UlaG (beta-lactamase superfamily)
VLIELDGVRVLTDPVLRSRVGPLMRTAPLVDPEAVGPVEGVLVSHLHADHADVPTLRRLERTGHLLAPAGAQEWLRSKGLQNVRGLMPGQTVNVEGLRVTATAAVHDRRRRPLGPAGDPIGYLVSGSGSVYFAGDTDLFPEMAELRGMVDVALLPVWGWGSRLGPGHLDPERAAAAAALIAPSVAIPIHWGTFTLGRRSRLAADREWAAREFRDLAARYAPTVEVRILAVGEATEIWPERADA